MINIYVFFLRAMEESFSVSLKWELIRRVAGLAIMSNLTLPVITNDKTGGTSLQSQSTENFCHLFRANFE